PGGRSAQGIPLPDEKCADLLGQADRIARRKASENSEKLHWRGRCRRPAPAVGPALTSPAGGATPTGVPSPLRACWEGRFVSERPVIGIATQTQEPIPGQLPATWIVGQCYVRVLTGLGAVPWVVPLVQGDEDTLRSIYDRLDGVFLTGGVDVDPASYGEPRHELCGKTDPARDWVELALVRWALPDRKPVLGVRRGIPAINAPARR